MLVSIQKRIRVQNDEKHINQLMRRAIWRLGELRVLIPVLFQLLATFRTFCENAEFTKIDEMYIFASNGASPHYAQGNW